MTFGINNVGKTLKYIDRKTGQVIAEFILVSYTLEYSFDPANPNTLIIVPHYNFVKTFDIDGLDGDNTVVAEFNLYTKNDKHCETRSYRVFDKKVGEFFTVEGARFGVAVIDGEIRPFYMTVSLITD